MLRSIGLLCATALLVGCAATGLNNTMLDVAPKDSSTLAHPDWGNAPRQRVTTVSYERQSSVNRATVDYQPVNRASMTRNSMAAKNARQSTIEEYLTQRGLAYQILPGDHMMIHLTESIHFKNDSTRISSQSTKWLSELANYLAMQSAVEVVINGHTDSAGQNQYNNGLSERRARAVKQVLQSGKVPTTRLFTRAYGEYLPTCSNDTAQGRSCNRRVELVLLVTQQ